MKKGPGGIDRLPSRSRRAEGRGRRSRKASIPRDQRKNDYSLKGNALQRTDSIWTFASAPNFGEGASLSLLKIRTHLARKEKIRDGPEPDHHLWGLGDKAPYCRRKARLFPHCGKGCPASISKGENPPQKREGRYSGNGVDRSQAFFGKYCCISRGNQRRSSLFSGGLMKFLPEISDENSKAPPIRGKKASANFPGGGTAKEAADWGIKRLLPKNLLIDSEIRESEGG